MKQKQNNTGLISAIIFASLVIAGSIIFFAMQSKPVADKNVNLQDSIEQGIKSFIQKQQEDAMKAEKEEKNAKIENLVKPNDLDYVRGNKKATITVLEYSDYECPFCKRFHGTMQQVLAEYGDQVNWIFRDFPLGFHDPIASKEAEATQCVGDLGGNEKYWEYSDLIFATTKSNKGLAVSQLPILAEKIGINKADFQKCMDDGKFSAKVQKSIQEGAKAGVRGTPGSFVINNKTGETEFLGGALPFNQMKAVIDRLLK